MRSGGIAVTLLILAALLWIGLHLGVSGTRLRDAVVGRVGEAGFRGVFSLLSVVTLGLLIWAWGGASTTVLWVAPDWLRWVLVLAMLPAFVLFVASVSGGNPTMIGPRAGDATVRGMFRVTRHPMLWSFTIWAAVHLIGNGDTAAVVFFGAMLITAFAGMPSIDAKLARRDGASWRNVAAVSSVVPFAAIVQGRNRFVVREIGWLTPSLGVVAWLVVLVLHPLLFGVAAVAGPI